MTSLARRSPLSASRHGFRSVYRIDMSELLYAVCRPGYRRHFVKGLAVTPEQIAFEATIGAECARLWMLVRADIAELRRLVAASQELLDATRSTPHAREIGSGAPPAEQA